jgi:hypothetical protein
MNNPVEQRIFDFDYDNVIFPSEYWRFYQDGTMIPEDKEQFFKEYVEHGQAETIRIHKEYEKEAAMKIAKILKAEADWRPETAAEKEAKRLIAFRKENLEMAELKRDLRFWDNNSDQ